MELPLHHMTTQKHWADIVLNSSTLQQIDQLRSWLAQHAGLVNQKNKLKDGYRVLFYGPAGTGKSTAASILAKEISTDIYRVDLAATVSKYIGETEKNLARLFDTAEQKGWILFFDEADALFGKRSDVKDSHDRYANLDVNYLLQRIESYNGLVIMASNMKSTIDEAFTRRFQSIIHFPPPTKEERKRIWEMALGDNSLFNNETKLNSLAENHELTPAVIINITDSIKTKLASKRELNKEQLDEALQAELAKLKSNNK
ncbi:ATP-binding protein [Terrimonas alba]|uniref:ATP-binding protein n=1 Tax=Terrimonas alba TaxID=3349636 RepID=UPI0035F38A05